MFIKGLPVLPVVEGGHAHNLFLLVDYGKRQDVLDGPTAAVQWLRLTREVRGQSSEVKGQSSEFSSRVKSRHDTGFTWNLNISSEDAFMMLQICRTKCEKVRVHQVKADF